MSTRPGGAASAVAWGLIGALVSSILLAPVGGTGVCIDAVEPAASSCTSSARSLVGLETDPWIWLGALAIAALATAVAARRRHASRDGGGTA